MRWTRTTTVAAVLSVALILGMTLTPDPPWLYYRVRDVTGPQPWGWSLEYLLNVALFVPLGMVLGWLRRLWLLPAAVALSITVELLQHLIGRGPKVDDVLANSIGAVAGYLVVAAVLAVRDRRRSRQDDAEVAVTS